MRYLLSGRVLRTEVLMYEYTAYQYIRTYVRSVLRTRTVGFVPSEEVWRSNTKQSPKPRRRMLRPPPSNIATGFALHATTLRADQLTLVNHRQPYGLAHIRAGEFRERSPLTIRSKSESAVKVQHCSTGYEGLLYNTLYLVRCASKSGTTTKGPSIARHAQMCGRRHST